MSFKSKEVKEQRAVVGEAMKALISENKVLNLEQREQFDRMNEEFDKLTDQAESLERAEKLESLMTRNSNSNVNVNTNVKELRNKKGYSQDQGFMAWLKKQAKCLPYDQERAATEAGFDLTSNEFSFRLDRRQQKLQTRATTDPQSSSASGLGVELVPTLIPSDISTFMKANSPIRQFARNWITPTGNPVQYPTSDGTGVSAAIISESAQDTVKNVPFSSVPSVVYTYSSGVVLIPYEWMQDAVIDVESYISDEMGRRFLRGTSTHLALGTGSSQPEGYAHAAGVGTTLASSTAITFAELSAWYDSVPLYYQMQPNFRFMVSQSARRIIRELVDSDGRPLWQPQWTSGLAAADQEMLFGHPLVVDPYLQATGTVAHTIGCCGDFDQFMIRSVEDDNLRLIILRERYADYRQIGLFGYARMGTVTLQSGALKSLKTPAS